MRVRMYMVEAVGAVIEAYGRGEVELEQPPAKTGRHRLHYVYRGRGTHPPCRRGRGDIHGGRAGRHDVQ